MGRAHLKRVCFARKLKKALTQGNLIQRFTLYRNIKNIYFFGTLVVMLFLRKVCPNTASFFPDSCTIRDYRLYVPKNILRSEYTDSGFFFFIIFKKSYLDAVFVTKIFAGNNVCLQEVASKINCPKLEVWSDAIWVTRTGEQCYAFHSFQLLKKTVLIVIYKK